MGIILPKLMKAMEENKKVLIYDGMIHEIKDLIRKQGSPGKRTQKKKMQKRLR